MIEFFVNHFSTCVFVAIILISLIPSVESKVAIPLALSVNVWAEATMSPMSAFICAFIGSMLPCLFVIFITKKIKAKTSGFVYDKFTSKLENKYKAKVSKLDEKPKVLQRLAMLAMFVALPLPLTGVYSGSVIAGLSNLKIWQSFVAIAIGEFISCLIVLAMCCLFENSAFYTFILSLSLFILFILIDLVYLFIKKKRRKNI